MGAGPRRISGKIVAVIVVAVIVIGSGIAIYARWQGGNESLEPFRAQPAAPTPGTAP